MLNRISGERCRTQTVTDTLGGRILVFTRKFISPTLFPKNSQNSPEHAYDSCAQLASQPLAISDSKMVISLGFPVTVHPEIPANKELVN